MAAIFRIGRRCTAMALIGVLSALVPGAAGGAEEGSFTGRWIASGKRQLLDFLPDREVFTYRVQGHVNLKDNLGTEADYWSECTGLWDSVSGSTGRCVWRARSGERVFIVLRGQLLNEGVKVRADVIGGTGSLAGVQGSFEFTWSSVFINPDTDTLTGHTEDIAGTYRIP
jgi:hypothetical protein